MRRILATSFLGLALVCLRAAADDAATIEAILTQAADTHTQALELEHGWSVTRPFIDEARAALAAGDLKSAMATAERALLTAQQSLEQARREADAWAGRVL